MNRVRSSEEGFSIIEVAIATMMVVIFFLAFAMSIDASTNNVRGNRNHTSAAGLLAEEFEYARSLGWDELAMSSVDESSPLLVDAETLGGSKSGMAADEVLVIDPLEGAVDPKSETDIEETTYTAWRHVTDAGDGLRRVIVVIVWEQQGETRTLQSSTLISEVTAEGSVAIGSTTTTSGGTTTTGAGTTTTTSGTTTTAGTELVVDKLTLKVDEDKGKSTGEVTVKASGGQTISGVTVHVRWSVSPGKAGYPFTATGVTDSKGKVKLVHNDSFPDGTTVEFCVTDLVKSGYFYDDGPVCKTKEWDD